MKGGKEKQEKVSGSKVTSDTAGVHTWKLSQLNIRIDILLKKAQVNTFHTLTTSLLFCCLATELTIIRRICEKLVDLLVGQYASVKPI